MTKTYIPKLLIVSTEEMIANVKVKANSDAPKCNLSYYDERACGAWADAEDGAGGGDAGSMCLEIGPLFGCGNDFYCSSAITPIAR